MVLAVFGNLCWVVVGWDNGCFVMVLVVLEVCCGVLFGNYDIFFNVVGGLKINEFVVDFVVVVVIVVVVFEVVLFVKMVVYGEISFFGDVRFVGCSEVCLKEVVKFGFEWVIVLENVKSDVGYVIIESVVIVFELV